MLRTTTVSLALIAALLTASCELGESLLGQCSTYEDDFQSTVASRGELKASIPDSVEGYAMAMVLNQDAVNRLFRELGDIELPALARSFGVPVLGDVSVALQPAIPTLAIGGNADCPGCISAAVPFSIGIGFTADPPPTGDGMIEVQMPIAMRADDEDNFKTAMVASFQSLSVLDIDFDVQSDLANTVIDAAAPIASELLTSWLRSRFENARIATFDSWAIGNGDVKLAGRGPFVHPETSSIVVAMQSNLPTSSDLQLDPESALPEGADIGFVFHPDLLLSMTNRMTYEGVIPQDYSANGAAAVGGGTKLTVSSMSTTEDNLLRTNARVWRTDGLCGTADLAASFGLTVEPGVFAFTVQDVEILGGEGIGQVLNADDWVGSNFIDSLVDTLDFTVNYDQVFGGSEETQAPMQAFRASIDGRGIQVYLNLLPE